MRVSAEGGDEDIVRMYGWPQETVESVELSRGDTLVVGMPRSVETVSLLSGRHMCQREGSIFMVPQGQEMDPLYVWRSPVEPSDETVNMHAVLHKQHAYAYITLVGVDDSTYPYYIKVSGNVAGIDVSTLQPVEGEFGYILHPVIGQECRVCLPRQIPGAGLSLDFFDRNMTRAVDSGIQGELPLGDYILESGFDWGSEDLADVYVDIDYVTSQVNVTVVSWERIEL